MKNILKKVSVGAVALLASVSAFATETAETVTLVAPSIDWASFATSLMSYITGVIVVAVGVGLGIWAFRKVYAMFKGFCR